MRFLLGFASLLALVSALPQKDSDYNKPLLTRILNGPHNPCGQGAIPECTCKSDTSITPTSPDQCPEGAKELECSCPNGEEVDLDLLTEMVRVLLVNSPRNPCGSGNRPSCECNDGSDGVFSAGAWCPDGLPSSCSCPDGTDLGDVETVVEMAHSQFRVVEDQETPLLVQILNSPGNPCGMRIYPDCICKSKPSIVPEIPQDCPEGSPDVQCTCPNGDEVDIDRITFMIRQRLKNSSRNPCGAGNEPVCVCSDASEPEFGPSRPCPDGLPESCSCPDGTPLPDVKSLVEMVHYQFKVEQQNQ